LFIYLFIYFSFLCFCRRLVLCGPETGERLTVKTVYEWLQDDGSWKPRETFTGSAMSDKDDAAKPAPAGNATGGDSKAAPEDAEAKTASASGGDSKAAPEDAEAKAAPAGNASEDDSKAAPEDAAAKTVPAASATSDDAPADSAAGATGEEQVNLSA
jgi:hypothetical protein